MEKNFLNITPESGNGNQEVKRIRDDSEKRILRCSEGNRVWYQMWINPGDMLRIEPLLEEGVEFR